MQQALIAFVTGKLQRTFWSPQQDMTARKLSAIAALALDGKATPALLDSLDIDPVRWPTHSVLDWLTVLEHVQVPGRAQRQQEARHILRNRLAYQGTQVGFSTDAQDHWWWLMQRPDVNAARLLLATIGRPDWDAERPRLVTGLLARQKSGAWATTTANLWAGLALRQFSAHMSATRSAATPPPCSRPPRTPWIGKRCSPPAACPSRAACRPSPAACCPPAAGPWSAVARQHLVPALGRAGVWGS